VSVQIFTPAQAPRQLQEVGELVRRVDDALQANLPAGARMGSETLLIRYTGR
jgi:hypothetical protein